MLAHLILLLLPHLNRFLLSGDLLLPEVLHLPYHLEYPPFFLPVKAVMTTKLKISHNFHRKTQDYLSSSHLHLQMNRNLKTMGHQLYLRSIPHLRRWIKFSLLPPYPQRKLPLLLLLLLMKTSLTLRKGLLLITVKGKMKMRRREPF